MARVLIIDDDVALGQALTKHLARAGHEVWHSADGDSGLIAAGRHAVEVILVDIFMPGKGGLQTIARLRRERPAVKIVAMSGVSAGALNVEEHAVALGADRFIRKPFEAASLVSLVGELVAPGKGESPKPV